MDNSVFWELIGQARKEARGNPFKQAELLVTALARRSEEDILAFQSHHDHLMGQAYRADLWGAAYIIGGGCSDDGFMDFRAWLIGQGKAFFEEALHDPETLVDHVDIDDETQVEDLLYVGFIAYQRKTGKEEMPPVEHVPSELVGELTEEEDDLIAKFPKLMAKFW